MTDTPNLHALAMRTAAAEVADDCGTTLPLGVGLACGASIAKRQVAAAIHSLPLEADPAALVAEALRLPEIEALVEAANKALPILAEYEPHPLSALSRLLTALTALDKP